MNANKLRQAAVVAQTYNNSDIWEKDSFRFKNSDIGKSELFKLKNAELIRDNGDGFSTTTWEWVEGSETVIKMVEVSPITETSDEQLEAIEEHAERILNLPKTETFFASEYDMMGQNIQTLSSNNLIEKVDTEGQLAVWKLCDITVRVITSIEAIEMRSVV